MNFIEGGETILPEIPLTLEEADMDVEYETVPILQEEVPKLHIEPESLEGVASAYRYKLMITNPELQGCAFNFLEEMDVFNFNDVNKKRALKKEEWPNDASLDHPQRWDVKIQLMAGQVEIKNCGGCSMWRDLTKKPFLILTPRGNRCIKFIKQPFILMIFRCCPKFHSYAKQFKLLVTLTNPNTGERYQSEVNIYRKKMNPTIKKRKGRAIPEDQDECEEEESKECDGLPEDRLESQSEPAPSNSPTKDIDSLDAALSLHETLFPEQNLLKRYKPDQNIYDPVLSALMFPHILQNNVPAGSIPNQKKNKSLRLTEQPFRQYQQELEKYQNIIERGQPVPQQVVSPSLLYDLLYPQKRQEIISEENKQLQKIKSDVLDPPTSIWSSENSILDATNDEKWLDSLLDLNATNLKPESLNQFSF